MSNRQTKHNQSQHISINKFSVLHSTESSFFLDKYFRFVTERINRLISAFVFVLKFYIIISFFTNSVSGLNYTIVKNFFYSPNANTLITYSVINNPLCSVQAIGNNRICKLFATERYLQIISTKSCHP